MAPRDIDFFCISCKNNFLLIKTIYMLLWTPPSLEFSLLLQNLSLKCLSFFFQLTDYYLMTSECSCCDRKPRAACAQCFAPWQQATIEIIFAISLTIACSRYIYNGVILHAHPVRGESHNQRNATGEVATTSPPFYNEPHRSHVLCVKVELGTTTTSWSQHHFVDVSLPL